MLTRARAGARLHCCLDCVKCNCTLIIRKPKHEAMVTMAMKCHNCGYIDQPTDTKSKNYYRNSRPHANGKGCLHSDAFFGHYRMQGLSPTLTHTSTLPGNPQLPEGKRTHTVHDISTVHVLMQSHDPAPQQLGIPTYRALLLVCMQSQIRSRLGLVLLYTLWISSELLYH